MQERKVNQWTLGFVIEHEIFIPNFGRHFLCVLEYIYKGIFQILQKELFFLLCKNAIEDLAYQNKLKF